MFTVLALIVLLGGLATSLVFTAMNEYGHGARMRDSLALSNLTEGGLERAKAQLKVSNAYRGEPKVALGRGEVSIRVEPDGKKISNRSDGGRAQSGRCAADDARRGEVDRGEVRRMKAEG